MKKLIIAAVGTMLGIAANAAAVTWGLTNITASPDNEAKAGMAAYFMDATTYSAFTALDADKVADYVAANYTYSGTTQLVSGRTGSSINIAVTSGTLSAGDTANGYIVLFDTASAADANNFAYTAAMSEKVPATGANITLSYGTFASATSGWQTTAVPEPTSGLLMLLGVAGLALRRRRA